MASDALISLSIDLDLRVNENLVLIQEDLDPVLEQRGASVRWVAPAQLHVAVAVVGRIERTLIARVRDVLAGVVGELDPFEFEMVGVGVYPDALRPRILQGRVGAGRDRLVELAERVDEALSVQLGLARDAREYLPEVLLGRVRTPQTSVDLTDVVEALAELPLGATRVRDVAIVESHLTPRGTHLQVLGRVALRGVASELARG